jgi:hypothetical protein
MARQRADIPRAFLAAGCFMQFRTWQIEMLRDGLRAYHALGELKGSGRYNWNDVKEAIDEYTNTVIPSETLRQFAERFQDPRRGGARSLQPERLVAIYEFLTHVEIRIFTREEFNETGFDSGVVLALKNALRRKHDKQGADYYESLPPLWRALQRVDDSHALTTLHFEEIGQSQGLFHVTERHETFFTTVIEEIIAGRYENLPDSVVQKHLANGRAEKIVANGYAIITPEGTLLVFLKERDSTNNRYYVSLFRQQDEGGKDTLAGILHRFDYEAELDPSERAQDPAFVAEHALQHVREGVLLFCSSKDHLFRRFSPRFLTPDALPRIGAQVIAMPPMPDVAVATAPDIFAETQERLSQKAADWKAKLRKAVERAHEFLRTIFRKPRVPSPPPAAGPHPASGIGAMPVTTGEEKRLSRRQLASMRAPYLRQADEETFRSCQARFVEAIHAPNSTDLHNALTIASREGVILDLNARHPDTGQTALHSAAAWSRQTLRDLLHRALWDHFELNYLFRDNRGWLPSKAAYLLGEDPVMGRFLLAKEKQAARKLGVALYWIDPDPAAWNHRVHVPPKFAYHS